MNRPANGDAGKPTVVDLQRELDALAYAVSHDMRAPLRAILGYAAALEEDCAARLDDEGRRMLAIVARETQRSTAMLDALLELSRIGACTLVSERVDMTALARRAAAACVGAAPNLFTIENLPETQGDRATLALVWAHLLENAVTATSGRADARVDIAGESKDARLVYRVSDNGIGFATRYADKLFSPFAKLHRSDRFPGVGASLAIVARIVRRHGGNIWADARPGEGATFFFALPAEVS